MEGKVPLYVGHRNIGTLMLNLEWGGNLKMLYTAHQRVSGILTIRYDTIRYNTILETNVSPKAGF